MKCQAMENTYSKNSSVIPEKFNMGGAIMCVVLHGEGGRVNFVVCYCQNGLRRNHGKCSLCNEWWHSFMNQRLNHLVLLYKKCKCIRIMSLNTYNKNVGIIWHYCIISQINLHGFWKRPALTNIKKDALKYMINRLWYGIFHTTCHINLRPLG